MFGKVEGADKGQHMCFQALQVGGGQIRLANTRLHFHSVSGVTIGQKKVSGFWLKPLSGSMLGRFENMLPKSSGSLGTVLLQH